MAKYKVQKNGKAQSGLKAGDEVVTGGGTYKITGVNADGTYKSEKVSNETTSTYKGTYAGLPSTSGTSNKNSQYTGTGYTIGSDKGKNIAQNMGIGQTYSASDGSLWKKENDGTITVNHGGQIYNNAYTPSDYSTLIKQQIAAGVPSSYVQDAINSRVNKAANDTNLNKYMYDDVYNMAWNYILDNQSKENQQNAQNEQAEWFEDYEYNNAQPGAYERDPRIDTLLSEILKRDDFSYDAMNDPLYQQYRQMYLREGDRAMRETLAEAAAGAGGMNTYAITAAQQANNYYNSQLNDKIPELYQLAYNMYLNDKESKVQDLGILQNMDATQYARYRDTINDYYNDRNFAYNAYQNAIQQGNYKTNFDYNTMLDNRDFMYNDYWTNKQWETNQADKDLANSRYDQETANEKLMTLISANATVEDIDPELIAQAGYTQEEVALLIAAVQAQNVGSSTGGGSSNGGNGYKDGLEAIAKATDGALGFISNNTVANSLTALQGNEGNAKGSLKEQIDAACAELFEKGGWPDVQTALNEARASGLIDQNSFMMLFNKYRDM